MATVDGIGLVVISITTVCVCFVGYALRKLRVAPGTPLPPGPKPLPFIGNLLDADPIKPWITYADWGRKYGDIVYFCMLGQGYVVVNSEKAIKELLEKRSKIYSDRPILETNKLFGIEFNTAFLEYGQKWRLHRKIYQQTLRADAMTIHHPVQVRMTHDLLHNLLDSPGDFMQHIKTFAASIIMVITYGYEPVPHNDPFVSRIEHIVQLASEGMTAEKAAIISAFPMLQYLPAWFPGMGFKKEAIKCQQLAPEVLDAPFEYARANLGKNAARSMVSDTLTRDHDQEEIQATKDCAASSFIAGSGSTASTLTTIIMAMVLYPDIQDKAQREIDTIVGSGRLPDFNDRESLPYAEAILREALRWHAGVPLGIPNMVIEDDVYEGYFIPKGTIILKNQWAMAYNEEKYPDPKRFDPERHLTVDGQLSPDSMAPAFGFGRRICPGRYLADSSIWISMVSVLAMFQLRKSVDSTGREIDVKPDFIPGVTLLPLPFLCNIKCRSADAEKLISKTVTVA